MIHLLVKCVVPKYDVKMQFYGLGDIGAYPEINSSQIKDEQWLLVIYDSTDIGNSLPINPYSEHLEFCQLCWWKPWIIPLSFFLFNSVTLL